MSDTGEKPKLPPVILDMGKVGRKKLRKFKKERDGEFLDDIGEAIEQVRAQLSPQLAESVILPVVLIYEKKSRKNKGLAKLLPI